MFSHLGRIHLVNDRSHVNASSIVRSIQSHARLPLLGARAPRQRACHLPSGLDDRLDQDSLGPEWSQWESRSEQFREPREGWRRR
jgi:hypothetical protein